MQIISMILSGLALLAASVSLILTIQEKKRSQKRSAAMIDYVYKECGRIDAKVRSLEGKTDKAFCESVGIASGLEQRVAKLEQGITPDYEQAKAAANAVNDFNRGISNILGFDPVAVARKQREQERVGGEAE